MSELAARWGSKSGAQLASAAMARLVAGRSLDGLGLGEHEGRTDMRFFPAPVPTKSGTRRVGGLAFGEMQGLFVLRDVDLVGIDFTGASLPSWRFHGSRIQDCVFDQAQCVDWRLWATDVEHCQFVGASLRQALVGSWDLGRWNRWQHVDFTGADFRAIASWAADFEKCVFDNTKLTGVQFDQCQFVDCIFSGLLRDVRFDGRVLPDRREPRPLQHVDFANARFDGVEFLGYRLDAVSLMLPDDPEVRLIRRYDCVAPRALEILENETGMSASMIRAELSNAIRMMRGQPEDRVFNLRDYRRESSELAELADRTFARAEADCPHV